ncbi:MAG TPA: signal peptidase I [Thermoanaerobaculia bacterium]|nr:signal peptidase I [Thermoanaerobaculia bacterium]
MKTAATILRIVIQPLAIGLIAALVVRATLLQAYSIPSGSMSPTLEAGDHILVTPMVRPLGGAAASRGDVVVFRNPDVGSGFFVKRVIALPGEHLEIRGGTVRVDGRVLEEPWTAERTDGALAEIVPADHVFVMGDHRGDSIDSRAWGVLPQDRIIGRARLIFWSSDNVSVSRAAAHSSAVERERPIRPRWNRILRRIR